MKKILLLSVFIASVNLIWGQSTISPRKDSTILYVNSYLKNGLALTDTQANQLLTLQRAQAVTTDSLAKLSDLKARGAQLRQLKEVYTEKLKQLFTTEQMARYEALEEAQRQEMKKRIDPQKGDNN